jgi:hypothetical protein
MRGPRENLSSLTVPVGQESTHEILIKDYEGAQQRADHATPLYEQLPSMNLESIYSLMQSLGEVTVWQLARLDLTSIATSERHLLMYLGLLSATKSPQAATKLISHKHRAAAKVAKASLVALGDQALAALEEEIKRQSGSKQVKAAQILSALPKSAAKKASAAALLLLTQGKTAEYLTKAAK